MPIKLTIEITGPLDPDDKDLLSGVAVMTLAIANHEMAKEHFPETFTEPDEVAEEPVEKTPPAPCAFVNPDDPDLICIGNVGHRGRHKFRRISSGDATAPLPN